MMNILYISYNGVLDPLLLSQGLSYISELSKSGYRFILLTFERPQDIQAHAGPGRAALLKRLSQSNIKWVPLRYHHRPLILARIFDLLQGIFISILLTLRYKIDILQARGFFPAMICLSVKLITGKRFIFDFRSQLSEAYVASGRWDKDGATFRLVQALENQCLKNSVGIAVETDYHRAKITDFLAKSGLELPTIVIPCCVDLARFKSAASIEDPEKGFIISYLGSLSGWYCVDEMAHFLIKAAEIIPGSCAWIITRDDPEKINTAIKNNQGRSALKIKVFNLPPDEVPFYLSRCRAGILFRYPGKRLSSFPIKIGEYLAAGLPVIINSGMGEVEDFVLKNRVGLLVNKFDDESFKSALGQLQSLLTDKDTRDRCIRAARLLSVEEGARKYLSLYSRVNSKGH